MLIRIKRLSKTFFYNIDFTVDFPENKLDTKNGGKKRREERRGEKKEGTGRWYSSHYFILYSSQKFYFLEDGYCHCFQKGILLPVMKIREQLYSGSNLIETDT